MSILVAISTRNRPEAFNKCLESVIKYSPSGTEIFVVDDASEPKYTDNAFRFEERAGISRVKNKCIELCMDSKYDHFFFLDDDVQIISHDWYSAYIDTGINHSSYCFGKGKSIGDGLKMHNVANGCMMYVNRKTIETVGGFDTRYPNKYEHCDWSRRIYNVGLTPARYIDVIDSHKLIYSLDEHNEIERGMTKREMDDALKSGYELFKKNEKSTEFINYK